ncbi:MAG: hypothetical protein ABIH38_05455 [Patescibacteria group bacterium]
MNNDNFEILSILRPAIETYRYAITAIRGWPRVSEEERQRIRQELGRSEEGQIDTVKMLSSLTQNLVGNCWEILVKNHYVNWDYRHPVIQFFRHIRNGCYHGNFFHFRGDEPIFEASWRGRRIERHLQGKKIFPESQGDQNFFLNWEDAILLLSEASRILKK